MIRLYCQLMLAALVPGAAIAADVETVCEQSESRITPSPDGQWTASVQERACATPTGAAAGITVVLTSSTDPSRSRRVYVMPVPRSRDDWPRVRWLGPAELVLHVPNLTEAAPPDAEFSGIRISLVYCGDNPQDREALAAYRSAVKQWQQDVTAWARLRKEDAAAAGTRPPRPTEPRLNPGRCVD